MKFLVHGCAPLYTGIHVNIQKNDFVYLDRVTFFVQSNQYNKIKNEKKIINISLI